MKRKLATIMILVLMAMGSFAIAADRESITESNVSSCCCC